MASNRLSRGSSTNQACLLLNHNHDFSTFPIKNPILCLKPLTNEYKVNRQKSLIILIFSYYSRTTAKVDFLTQGSQISNTNYPYIQCYNFSGYSENFWMPRNRYALLVYISSFFINSRCFLRTDLCFNVIFLRN